MAKKRTTVRRPAEDQPEVRPKRYSPPPCNSCAAMAKGENYTDTVRTITVDRSIIRHLKCRLCGATWKQVSPLIQR